MSTATAAPTTLFLGTNAADPAFLPSRVSLKWQRASADAFRGSPSTNM